MDIVYKLLRTVLFHEDETAEFIEVNREALREAMYKIEGDIRNSPQSEDDDGEEQNDCNRCEYSCKNPAGFCNQI